MRATRGQTAEKICVCGWVSRKAEKATEELSGVLAGQWNMSPSTAFQPSLVANSEELATTERMWETILSWNAAWFFFSLHDYIRPYKESETPPPLARTVSLAPLHSEAILLSFKITRQWQTAPAQKKWTQCANGWKWDGPLSRETDTSFITPGAPLRPLPSTFFPFPEGGITRLVSSAGCPSSHWAGRFKI